jgi:hypothetical protein
MLALCRLSSFFSFLDCGNITLDRDSIEWDVFICEVCRNEDCTECCSEASVDSDGVVGRSEAGLDGPTDMHFRLSDWTTEGRSSNTV